jgi:hypothetical protein
MQNMNVPSLTSLAAAGLLLTASVRSTPAISAQPSSSAITPSGQMKLFDGKSLENFETWLVDDHRSDPRCVYTVVDQVDGAPAIRISGQVWGGLLTKQAYKDYKLTAEYRWGGATWGDRRNRTRDSGILLHARGRPGNTRKDFNGPWLMSLEFQIIEGGVGDFISVAGFTEDGQQIRPTLTVRSRKDRDGENVFDPKGEPNVFSSGRVNWWGRSEDWVDKLGFRGPHDVESPALEWTRLEAIVQGGNLKYFVNGTLVLEGTDSNFTDGKIMVQSEGAEIYFRRVDLEPLR